MTGCGNNSSMVVCFVSPLGSLQTSVRVLPSCLEGCSCNLGLWLYIVQMPERSDVMYSSIAVATRWHCAKERGGTTTQSMSRCTPADSITNAEQCHASGWEQHE